MSNRETYRFVAGKINEIQSLVADLGDKLENLGLALPKKNSCPEAAHLHSTVKDALELLENISIVVDAIQYKLAQPNTVRRKPRSRTTSNSLRQVRKISIQPGALGISEVTIDDWEPFCLSANLAALLEVLAMDAGIKNGQYVNDSLVPFKRTLDVILSLAKRLGREPLSERALRMRICRLRKVLAESGFEGLIQTDRQLRAYRVALRRKSHRGNDEDSGGTSKS